MISHKLTDTEEACARRVAGWPDDKRWEQLRFWASYRKTRLALRHEGLELFNAAKARGENPKANEFLSDADLHGAARASALISKVRELMKNG